MCMNLHNVLCMQGVQPLHILERARGICADKAPPASALVCTTRTSLLKACVLLMTVIGRRQHPHHLWGCTSFAAKLAEQTLVTLNALGVLRAVTASLPPAHGD